MILIASSSDSYLHFLDSIAPANYWYTLKSPNGARLVSVTPCKYDCTMASAFGRHFSSLILKRSVTRTETDVLYSASLLTS